MTTAPTRRYFYRGQIEVPCTRRGRPSYRKTAGYSQNGKNGQVTYPWQSRRQCQLEARIDGVRAVFE